MIKWILKKYIKKCLLYWRHQCISIELELRSHNLEQKEIESLVKSYNEYKRHRELLTDLLVAIDLK